MYSLWSNYIYIHRELWHYSKKPFLFQALEIVSQVLTDFSGFCFLPGFSCFWNRAAAFRICTWNARSLSLLCRCFCQPHLSAIAERLAVYRIPDRLFTRRLLCHFMQIDYAVLTEPKRCSSPKSRRSHLQQLGWRGRHVPIRCHNLFFVSWADSLRRTDRNRPSGYHSSAACALGSAVSQLPPRGFLRSPPQRRSV